MSTTTIRIEEELKACIASAAARIGKSSHAFIVDVLAEMVERSEMDEILHRIADERWDMLQHNGESVGWDDAKAYVHARAVGKRLLRPAARKPVR